ncbi:MAG: hypothetical protein JWP03_2319, partial [Phycisphaerales bacterium]|nr:hypothetical protein [Phycisphaerales bacterium]
SRGRLCHTPAPNIGNTPHFGVAGIPFETMTFANT